jgi:hypothetical protein
VVALRRQLAIGSWCVPKTSSLLAPDGIIALMCFCLRLFTLPLKSEIRLEAENTIHRHQLIVLEGKIRGCVRLTKSDRLFLHLALSLVSPKIGFASDHPT